MLNFKPSGQVKKELGEHTLFGRVNVYTLQSLPEHIDLEYVIETVEERVPSIFFHDIDSIFIGYFKEFEERDVNAFYSDAALFITNDQTTDEDLLDDIVHETAHAVERMFPEYIYDHDLELEFVGKRKRLFQRLKSDHWDVDLDDFVQVGYSKDFDNLLYAEIGYPVLSAHTVDLFNSPYGATSIQEYWANGFEGFFLKSPNRIRGISPQIYNKITTLINKYK
tara:strand:- start:243 stop:911 length:669 start_codon:yes stop_codon:yes gene_type:complete